MNIQLVWEAIAVGIILVLISLIVMGALHRIYPNDYTGCINLPKSSAKYYVATFAIGIITHLACEATGINHWYCRSGNACKSKNKKSTHPASW